MPKVSIIVPVYNAVKTLNRCIDSILAQTFTNFELILVNDGSTDNSGKICDEYAQKDSRIIVVHKDNGGVSSARNKGLDIAQGVWITFVDSDDYLYKDFLKSFNLKLNIDLYICGVAIFGAKESILIPKCKKTTIKHQEIGPWIAENCRQSILYTPWAKLYKKSIITTNNLKFNTLLRYGEDTIFIYTYLNLCNSIFISPHPYYNYLSISANQESIKYRLNATEYLTHIDHITEAINLLEDTYSISLKERKLCLYSTFLRLFYSHINSISYTDAILELKKYNKYNLIKYKGRLNLKEYLYLRLVTLLPHIFFRSKNA